MAQKNTIPEIMRKHHHQLEGLLNRCKKYEQDFDAFRKSFNRFKWELEKHFFTEERAIFTFIYSEDTESNEMKSHLLKEHNTILNELNRIESDMKNDNKIDFSGCWEMLKNHREFEEENFYPKLESELDGSKKKQIMDRISNPV
jgi:hemerythrin superfamily protein